MVRLSQFLGLSLSFPQFKQIAMVDSIIVGLGTCCSSSNLNGTLKFPTHFRPLRCRTHIKNAKHPRNGKHQKASVPPAISKQQLSMHVDACKAACKAQCKAITSSPNILRPCFKCAFLSKGFIDTEAAQNQNTFCSVGCWRLSPKHGAATHL